MDIVQSYHARVLAQLSEKRYFSAMATKDVNAQRKNNFENGQYQHTIVPDIFPVPLANKSKPAKRKQILRQAGRAKGEVK